MTSDRVQAFFQAAPESVQKFNRIGLHYNLVADRVYQELRRTRAPFSEAYEPYLVAALISFDLQRMMGQGSAQKYDRREGGFAWRLHTKLDQVRPCLEPIIETSLDRVDIDKHASDIAEAYDILALGGEGSLHAQGDNFHVGATKILHFLNPELFIIVDSNAAKTLRQICDISYRNTTQPGYSSALYICSMKAIRDLVNQYGVEEFRSLEPGTPLTRIFDKISFGGAAE